MYGKVKAFCRHESWKTYILREFPTINIMIVDVAIYILGKLSLLKGCVPLKFAATAYSSRSTIREIEGIMQQTVCVV